MLNKLKNNQTTIKMNLIKALNNNYTNILADKVLHDTVIPILHRRLNSTRRLGIAMSVIEVSLI